MLDTSFIQYKLTLGTISVLLLVKTFLIQLALICSSIRKEKLPSFAGIHKAASLGPSLYFYMISKLLVLII